ncbi:MAG: hypothetical protein JSV84_03780, partial [Gemmatimonadota bacterium]
VVIQIDLMDEHPLPVKGLVLGWDSTYLPHWYSVEWADAGGRYHGAEVPTWAGIPPPDEPGIVPIPISFQDPGINLRYVKFAFPPRTFTQRASLEEIRFLYDWGPDDDATYNPLVGACCLPDGKCTTVTERMCDTYG